jgi:hypothetical protein
VYTRIRSAPQPQLLLVLVPSFSKRIAPQVLRSKSFF